MSDEKCSRCGVREVFQVDLCPNCWADDVGNIIEQYPIGGTSEVDTEFKLVIKGFESQTEVEEFIGWYANSGEQDLSTALECYTRQDCRESLNFKRKENNGNITIMHVG